MVNSDQQMLSMLSMINGNIIGKGKAMTEVNNQSMLQLLIQINGNLVDLKRMLAQISDEGLKVRTQQSNA